MADIFLSYSRVDLPRARQFEEALGRCGWSVFWDRELLPGEGYRRAIERELDSARCVIVLWSHASVESEWVIDEAESGRRDDRLVSVRIDDVELPLGFRQLHAASLVNWPGDVEDRDFELLNRRLHALIPLGEGPVRIASALEPASHPNDRIAELQRHLLTAPSSVELKAARNELEAWVQRQPSDRAAQLLLEHYREAIVRSSPMPAPAPVRFSIKFSEMHRGAIIAVVSVCVLVVGGLIYLMFRLGALRSLSLALALPFVIWGLVRLLSGAVALLHSIHDRTSKR